MNKTLGISVVTIFASILLLQVPHAEEKAAQKNPFAGNAQAIKEGSLLFKKNCEGCHGAGAKGDIGPNLTLKKKKYGNSDSDLFYSISKGRKGGMPEWGSTLATENIWKVITYLRSVEK